jgi:hypothetical protein
VVGDVECAERNWCRAGVVVCGAGNEGQLKSRGRGREIGK